ncbi:MAG TPA: alpha/beta fold hydrolase [Ramlibacter sp.]|nr:alpha/beta fold hydrolase [Ramlibacter sp.]
MSPVTLPDMKTIRAGELEVAYRIEGPTAAPVLMLAHGIMTTHRMWDQVAANLSGRWRVLRYDLRGHGGTTATQPPYTMGRLAEDAIALLDALDIPQVHFAGTSLGGMLGQQFGARFGTRLVSLTLSNTTSEQTAPGAWNDRISLARDQGMTPLVEPTLQRWFTDDYLQRGGVEIEQLRKLAMATGVLGFNGCAAAVRDLSQAQLLGQIRVPTLVIAGAFDRATPPGDSHVLQQNIPGAELAMLPAAHQAAVECAAAWSLQWERFADRHKGPARSCP